MFIVVVYPQRTAEASGSRTHRHDKRQRTIPEEANARANVIEPVLKGCRMSADGSGALEWLMDMNPNDANLGLMWKKGAEGVTEQMQQAYVKHVRVDTRAEDNSLRCHSVTGKQCQYRKDAPMGLPALILKTFSTQVKNRVSVSMVMEPIRRMSARGGILADAVQQGFMMSDNAIVTFSLTDVRCRCDVYTKKALSQNSKSFYWCQHIIHIFMQIGKVPGDYELLQAGFTPEECGGFMAALGQVQEVGRAKEGEWLITNPTKRTAKCQGAFGIGRQKCTMGDIGAQEKRLIVHGQRKVGEKWHATKFSFHVRASCINQQFNSIVKVGRPPSQFCLEVGCVMTPEERLLSGLTIVESNS